MAGRRDDHVPVQQRPVVLVLAEVAKVDQLLLEQFADVFETLRNGLGALTEDRHPEVDLPLVQLEQRVHQELWIFVVLPAVGPNQVQGFAAGIEICEQR